MHLNITCKSITKSNSVLLVCIITWQFDIKVKKLVANISTICNCQTLYKLWQADARFDSCPGEESTSCLCSSNWRTQTCRANRRAVTMLDQYTSIGSIIAWPECLCSSNWRTQTCRAHWRANFAWPQHVGPEHILTGTVEHIPTDAQRHVGQVGSELEARRHLSGLK